LLGYWPAAHLRESFPSIHESTTPSIQFFRAGCELVEETSQGFNRIMNLKNAPLAVTIDGIIPFLRAKSG
jgi:hypothetical protein